MTITTVGAGTISTDTITNGNTLNVLAGGTETSGTILSGGVALIAGLDEGTTIALGGMETLTGTASGDAVFGTQLENAATALVSNETIYNGGTLEMFATSGHASNITVESGGALLLSANAPVNNLVIQGGSVLLESKKANITGTISFAGAGTLQETAVISAGYGDLAVIEGFGFGDVLDLSAIGGGAVLTSSTSGGNTVLTVSGGSSESTSSESFTLAGTGEYFGLTADPTGTGEEISLLSAITIASGSTTTSGYVVSGATLTVLAGGSATDITVAAGGSAVIAGTDSGSTIALGGTEIVTGSANADVISGQQTISGTASGETLALGGTVTVVAGGTAANMVLSGGVLELAGATPTLTGGLTFAAGGTLLESGVIGTGYGDGAVISGFGAGDVIDLAAIGSGATLTSAAVGGNTVLIIAGGSTEGGAVESFTFSGTGNEIYALGPDAGGLGETLSASSPVITVANGQTLTGQTVAAGYELLVSAGGTAIGAVVLAGGSAVISGTDSGSTIALGGTETVFGTAGGDIISGALVVSGTASGETIANGGAATITAGGTASGFVLSGGVLDIASPGSTLSGDITFAGNATLEMSGSFATGQLISGFTTGDVIDLTGIGTGDITSASTVGGDTVLTILSESTVGGSITTSPVETLTFAGTGDIYQIGTDAAGTGETVTAIPIITSFTAGDIVVGVVGDDNDSGYYGDNQAAPIALEEIDPATGLIVGEMVLPQATSVVNGTVENIISGEYGSSSEGILQLAGNGQSLVIAGYGVNAAAYNAAEASGNPYGNAALAQTSSLTDGSYIPVARVIADIGYNGTIDTSTALYNVFNTNNPRSVITVNGTTFYISGQGVKGDTTQGVFVAQDGASSATAIDDATDTRTVEIYNGQLYVSQNSSSGTSNIETFNGLPTGATTPTILSGIDLSVILTAAQANAINAGAVGTSVALSPEEYFFANATTLYVADGGQPKAGTIGDGGLQKWTLNTTTGVWSLDYTLSAGLNLVDNSSVSGNTDGTTGLVGLTGSLNADGTVTFYATNSTIADLDQTYVYTITDTVAATTAAPGESFSVVETAAPDTNDRGIAFAPSAPSDTTIAAGTVTAGLTITNGSTLTVEAGGTAAGAVVLSGGTAYVSGLDDGSLIVLGATETVYGSATADNVYGLQIVSGGVGDETVYYDGEIDVQSGGTASDIAMQAGSELVISGSVSGLTVSGGVAALAASTAALSGVTFAGAGEVAELAAGGSITGVVSGFGVGDIIDLTQFGAGSVLTSAVTDGITVETVTSGGVSQSITLAGLFAPGALGLVPDASNGFELAIAASSLTGAEEVTAGEYGGLITVAGGGTLHVDAGATVTQNLILSGGTAVIDGFTSDDVIDGSETLGGGTAFDETLNGGILTLDSTGSVTNVTATAGTIELASGATLAGALVLGADVTLDVANGASLTALISGFSYADNIDLTDMTTGATLTSGIVGGNTVETVTSNGVSESFTFAGTYATGYFVLNQSAAGDTLTTQPPITNGFVATTAGVLGVVNGAWAGTTTSSDLVISSGAVLDVLTGASVSAPMLLAGGIADISGTESGAVVSSGGVLVLSAGGVESGATILNGGTETLIGPNSATGDQVYGLQQVLNANSATGTTLSGETIFNGGTVDLFYKGNALVDSTILSGGVFAISGNATGENLTLAGGTIELESPKSNLTGTLSFTTGGTLVESDQLDLGIGGALGVIDGFGLGDTIELTSTFGTGITLETSSSGGYTVATLVGAVDETFTFAGTVGLALQQLAGGGADLLGENPLCFMAGTMIRTPRGEVAVETLRRGDLVVTADGAVMPVSWLGRQTVARRFADPDRAWPVRIKAGALADNMPARDLRLSPGHAVLVDGVLILASALVNGASVVRETDVPEIFTYYHIELDEHALVLAENTPAETFIDNIDRLAFDNWDEHLELYPNGRAIKAMPYPLAKSPRQVPAGTRAKLIGRLGHAAGMKSAVA